MSFIDDIKNRAKKDIKTIVLPEAEDIRILQATDRVYKEEYAKIILVGNRAKIEAMAAENNLDVSKAIIEDPTVSDKHDLYKNGVNTTPYLVIVSEGSIAYKELMKLSNDAEANVETVKSWMEEHIEWGNN